MYICTSLHWVLSSDRRTPLALLGAVLLEPETLLDELDCLGITGVLFERATHEYTDLGHARSSRSRGSYLGQLIRDLDARLVVDRVELRDARLPASVVTSRFDR